MKRGDIEGDVWTIATEKREKGNAGALRLPPVALDIIAAQDEVVGNPYLFPGNERKRQHPKSDRSKPPHFNAWSKSKPKFDKALPAECRAGPSTTYAAPRGRSCRGGVASEHAERVLGHVIGGVESVYDRHAYDGRESRRAG